MNRRMLIKGGTAILGEDKLTVRHDCDILIEDEKIKAVDRSISAEGAEVVDASEMLVIPGLVDTHRHLWQTLMRGLCSDGTVLQYTEVLHLEYGAAHDAEDVYLATYIGALEAIDGGVTTLGDHAHTTRSPAHAEAALAGMKDSGIAGILFHSLYDAPAVKRAFPDHAARLQYAREFHRRHFQSPGQIKFGLALNEPKETLGSVFQAEAKLARECGARMSAHVGNMSGAGRIATFNSLGILGPDILFIHCNGATDEEFKMMANCGASVSVTPESEAAMGLGTPVTGRCLALGMRPSFGVDLVPFSSGDLLAQIRWAVAFQRYLNNEKVLTRGRIPATVSPSVEDGLRFATIDGARALGMDGETGSITVGKRADLVLMRRDQINHIPPADPIADIIFHSRPHDIDTVIVAGAVKKRSGRLVGVDLGALRQKAKVAQAAIHEKARNIGPLSTPGVAAFARLKAVAE